MGDARLLPSRTREGLGEGLTANSIASREDTPLPQPIPQAGGES